jgi:hypothetical protein
LNLLSLLRRIITRITPNKEVLMPRKLVVACLLALTTFASAAEYNGRNIDLEEYDCTAFSYSTSKYYQVTVEFDGDEATITFSNGGRLTLTLDDEEIDDPSSISAFDYKKSTYWDLEVDGLE